MSCHSPKDLRPRSLLSCLHLGQEWEEKTGRQVLEILPLQWAPCGVPGMCPITLASYASTWASLLIKTPFPDWLYLQSTSTVGPILKVLWSSSNCTSFVKPSHHPWNHLMHEIFPEISSPPGTSLLNSSGQVSTLVFCTFWHIVIFIPTVNLVYDLTKRHHI